MLILIMYRAIVNVWTAFIKQILDVSRLRTPNVILGLSLKFMINLLFHYSSNAISDEILRRLEVNFPVAQPLRNLFGDHSESLKTRSCNSAKRACGRSSRAANYLYYNGFPNNFIIFRELYMLS